MQDIMSMHLKRGTHLSISFYVGNEDHVETAEH